MQPIALIVSSVVIGVVGQLVLKSGVGRIGPLGVERGRVVATAWRIFTDPRVIVGLGLYGISTFFWLVALSRVELGYAYPFISLSYILILLSSWLLFGEDLSAQRLFGVAAICLGVYVVAAG